MRISFITEELRPQIDNFIEPVVKKDSSFPVSHSKVTVIKKPIILLVGTLKDHVLSMFSGFLSREKFEFLFLELNELAHTVYVYGDYIVLGNKKIPFDMITGVYCRFSGFKEGIEDGLPTEYFQHAERLTYLCNNLFENVVNRPCYNGSNNSKLYQLRKVSENNLFKIPDSLLLANSDCPKFNEEWVYKSSSGQRSIVSSLDEKLISREVTCPVLFQKRLCGPNFRVHVIDEKVYAMKIKTYGVDYRYMLYQPSFITVDLPEKIVKQCIDVTKLFNLSFSGIDLMFDNADSEYYFLEANTAPGYVFFEEFMEEKIISKELANFLIR